MLIEFHKCSISILNKIILEDMSFKIESGSLTQIKGENGSGKTVLMNSMLKLNHNIIGEYQRIFDKRNICYVSDTAFFFDDDSVRDVFRTVRYFYGVTETIIIEKLEMLSINHESIKNQKIYELSKGMRKKLMILPIFFGGYNHLFLDEVFTGLDVSSQRKLLELLKVMIDDGITIVFIEHNQDIAEHIMSFAEKGSVIEC